jgi:diacylglycerol kinase family enzyme
VCKRTAICGVILEWFCVVNVWILCNEDSGRSLSDANLRQLVQHAGHTVVDLVTKKNVKTRPPRRGVDLIVAAGGDGTVKIGVSLVAGTSTPLAVLPLGTANNIATSLGIAADVPQLISSWDRARRVPIDLGYARAGSKEWLVVEGVGGGLIPAGIAAAERALESADSHPVVEVAAAVRVFYDVLEKLTPMRRTITIDGERFSEELLMFEVLNMRSVGPNLVLAPDANLSDGLFDVILAGPAHRAELLDYLESRIDEKERRVSLPCYRARQVHIDSCEELHIDDERVDMSEAEGIEMNVAAGAAMVLM